MLLRETHKNRTLIFPPQPRIFFYSEPKNYIIKEMQSVSHRMLFKNETHELRVASLCLHTSNSLKSDEHVCMGNPLEMESFSPQHIKRCVSLLLSCVSVENTQHINIIHPIYLLYEIWNIIYIGHLPVLKCPLGFSCRLSDHL